MNYSIKNFKTFKGHEGEPCAQGSLCRDNKKIAEWSDDSWGGPLMTRFINKEEEALFLEYAKSYLKTKKDFEKKPYEPSSMNPYTVIETAVLNMSYDFSERKRIEKMCKTKIVFSLGDTEETAEIYSINIPYTEENIKKLKEKHKNIVTIYNEQYQKTDVIAKKSIKPN